MSEDEVLRFEITEEDLEAEYNPGLGRNRASKEQQIYGVWAKDSDDEENEDHVRSRTRKTKDYSAPIGFVAGGVQQAGKKKEKNVEAIEPASPSSSRAPVQAADSSSEDERPQLPSESETAGIRRKGQGMRSAPQIGGSVGNWEKHTKGIGAKLLLQMGYKPGKGLGKDLQGISAPVEATLRKGRGAIGAYGPEKAALKALKAKREEEIRVLKEKGEAGEPGEKSYHWKKSHKGRYFYRDAADVIQEGKPSMHTVSTSELSRVPVIDMTGKEKRVLSGYHALRSAAPRYEHEPRRQCRNFSAPELTHNLELMVECCEQDIIQNAREQHTAEDEIVATERDLLEHERRLQDSDSVIGTVEAILEKVEHLDTPDLTLDDAYTTLNHLMMTYPLEYEIFGVGTIAGNLIDPLLAARLVGWDPLQAPDEPTAEFERWRHLVPPDAYHTLLWHHFIPQMKKTAELWNPRVPAPMLRALAAWERACPAWLLRECVVRCVAPRLLSAVRVWDPTGDTQPLHQWVLPWHERAGTVLATTVYPLIRSRLATALGAWHPADTSAKPLLGAWREAWGPALSALLHQHIVPKLEACLQQAPVELVGRENTAWLWCVDWLELMGAASVAALACRALLPRWLAALAAWLNTNPQHATVLNSYTTFKKMFPDEILKEPGVRDAFRKALDMMNRSADINMDTDMELKPPPPPRYSSPKPAAKPELTDPSRFAEVLGSSNQAKSFSELLESRCLERGISLLPMVGRSREGRPLYKIGGIIQCYVIRNVVMYSSDAGRTFLPVSLDKLLQMAEE